MVTAITKFKNPEVMPITNIVIIYICKHIYIFRGHCIAISPEIQLILRKTIKMEK